MDLSKLLGDLYDPDDSHRPASARRDEASPSSPLPGPEWADEERLDEAFASWRPGPPDDAPAAEREMAEQYPGASFPQLEAALAGEDNFPLDAPGRSGDDEGQASQPGGVTTADLDPLDIGEPRAWTRSDDDVLPRRRSGRLGLRLSRLRR